MSAPTATMGASGVLLEAMSCDVCLEVYEQTIRTPLVLPCGHTFCRKCLTAIKTSGGFLCPKCKTNHNNSRVETLTVNYSLLNILPHCSESDLRCDKCATHGDDLRYWCATCNLPLCSLCLYSGHPQGHTVKLAQAFVEEKKLMLVEKINGIFSKIEEQKNELGKGLNDLDGVVKQFFLGTTHLNDNEAALNGLLAETRKANSISSVMHSEKAVAEFQSKEKNLTGLEDELVAWICEDSDKEKNLFFGDKEVLPGKAEDLGEAAAEATKKMQPVSFGSLPYSTRLLLLHARKGLSNCGRNLNLSESLLSKLKLSSGQSKLETRAAIDYRDGRLLLHTLAEPVTTRLSLQVPSEVFLELSVGRRCLGRVYISLWCHMRQAQQFLALCMGTLGPSLLGTKASEKVRNVIVFKSAVDKNNQLITNNLLTGLEWGGQHSKAEIEGLVSGISGNNSIAFGICTRVQLQTPMNAPFGKVVAGLEAAREAFQHNPVTEVTITHCGIVLPGLS